MCICIHCRNDQNRLVPLGARQVGSQDHDSSPWPGPLGFWMGYGKWVEAKLKQRLRSLRHHHILQRCMCTHTHILYTYIYTYLYIYISLNVIYIYIHAIYTYHHTYYFLSNHQVGGAPAVAKAGFKETVTWDGFLYVTRPMPEVWRGFTWFQPFTVCQMSC